MGDALSAVWPQALPLSRFKTKPPKPVHGEQTSAVACDAKDRIEITRMFELWHTRHGITSLKMLQQKALVTTHPEFLLTSSQIQPRHPNPYTRSSSRAATLLQGARFNEPSLEREKIIRKNESNNRMN